MAHEPDEIVASFRRHQRGVDLATAIVLVSAVASAIVHIAFGHTWPTFVAFAAFVVVALGAAVWSLTERSRRALRRGPRHRGLLVAHGPALFELRTKDGPLWVRGPHVEHAALPAWRALLRRDPREVTVVGPTQTTSDVPAEIAGTTEYRGGASIQVIEGTLEHPAWTFGERGR